MNKKKSEPRKTRTAGRPGGKKPAPAKAEAPKKPPKGAAAEAPPTLEEWKALYDEAQRFQKLACWQWMTDEDLFAMICPEEGLPCYLCVLGNAQEEFGLVVYLGAQGLRSYYDASERETVEDPLGALGLQKCLVASFGDGEDLEKDDRKVIKSLDLKLKEGCWPQFRSYRPGYLPWFLTGWEARLLTHALREARDVGGRMQKNRDLLAGPRSGQLLTRVPARAGAGLRWEDRWVEPSACDEKQEGEKPALLDDLRLKRLSVVALHRPVVVELDLFTFKEPIQDEAGSRPYIPRLLLGAEHGTGHVHVFGLVKPADGAEGLHDVFLAALEKTRFLPDELLLRKQEVLEVFAPIGRRLDINLTLVTDLPAVDAAHASFLDYAARQGRFPGE